MRRALGIGIAVVVAAFPGCQPADHDAAGGATSLTGDDAGSLPSGERNDEKAPPDRPAGSSQVSWYLSDRAWSSSSNGWGPVERDRSNGETGDSDGLPLKIRGVTFEKGLGAHAPSDVRYSLGQRCTSFTVAEGIDDETVPGGQVTFQIWADGVLLDESEPLDRDSPVRHVSVRLDGRRELKLVVTDGLNGTVSDHADWAGARIECDEESASPPPFSDDAWRLLGLVIRNTDVAFIDPATGQSRRVTTRLAPAEELGAIETLRQTPKYIVDWSKGRGRATLDVITLDDTIRSVTPASTDPASDGSFMVSSADVKPLLDAHAPPGRYDSIFVMWDPNDSNGSVPVCCLYGGGRSAETNGATFATIPIFDGGAFSGPYPAEGLIHEWLHGSTDYYRTERGLLVPDPHDNALYGFHSADAHGSWADWYKALLAGELTNVRTGARAGMSETVWASGRPNKPRPVQSAN